MDIKKIEWFDFFSWVWQRFYNFYLFSGFEKYFSMFYFCVDLKEISQFETFLGLKKNY